MFDFGILINNIKRKEIDVHLDISSNGRQVFYRIRIVCVEQILLRNLVLVIDEWIYFKGYTPTIKMVKQFVKGDQFYQRPRRPNVVVESVFITDHGH